MNIVTSTNIDAPKVEVSPPLWVLTIFWAISIALFIAIGQLAAANVALKYVLACIYGLALLGVLRKQLKGNYLVTLQANLSGMYFQTDDTDTYLHVPWKNIGAIEKTIFPLNTRGLRIEITGDLIEPLKRGSGIGNVRTEAGRTFIYTIPQLRDRDRLIAQFESFRNGFTNEQRH